MRYPAWFLIAAGEFEYVHDIEKRATEVLLERVERDGYAPVGKVQVVIMGRPQPNEDGITHTVIADVAVQLTRPARDMPPRIPMPPMRLTSDAVIAAPSQPTGAGLTAHTLAMLLLEGPDIPVVAIGWDGITDGPMAVIGIRTTTETYDDGVELVDDGTPAVRIVTA